MKQTLTLLLIGFILGCAAETKAQEQADSVTQRKPRYIPDAAVVQFAGNMGMLSAGPGYDFAKRKLAADLLYGYVPKFDSDEAEHLLTIKGTYKPWEIKRRRDFTVIPIQIGLGLSYYLNDKYPLVWDEKYPKQYYWWSPKVRLLGFAGATVTRQVRNSKIKTIGLYSEFGTYDLIFTSWFKDDGIGIGDIVNLSVGTRIHF